MNKDDRSLLVRLAKVNSAMGEIVLKLLADGHDTGDLQPQGLLDLANILDPMANALPNLVAALRQRAADLGVVQIDAPAREQNAQGQTEKCER